MVFIPGMGGKYPFCNSLYIDDKKKAIIDPASDESFLRKLAGGKKVDIIINSHYHEDHIAFNYLFPEAELYVHEAIGDLLQVLQLISRILWIARFQIQSGMGRSFS